MENRFKVFIPADIFKSENGVIKFKGVASIQSKDSSGETIDLEGADLSDFNIVNWNHGKDTGDIMGQIDSYKLTNGKLLVEGSLYSQVDKVKKLVELEKAIKENNGKLRLALSVEGKATERDSINPKRITRSRLSGVALTYSPVHKGTEAELILKSFDYDPMVEYKEAAKSEANGGKQYIIDITNPETGMRYLVDKNFNLKIEKAITTETASATRKESLDGKVYNLAGSEIKKSLIILAAAKKLGKLSPEKLELIKKSQLFRK